MEVLISPTETFNLNQPTSKLIDQKMCVYDCSEKIIMIFILREYQHLFHTVIQLQQ